ncbi:MULTISPECIES: hypothetical protein [unclassified Streptomyces]|uniref:hypothetical protein n=1 Tax=unclassified Streptomyces TaxID=2593676 RepID=UPI00342064B6
MSRRTDNRHRVATICREATGLAHHTCMQWAADGLITRHQPVPDAATAEQRAFEARVALVLGNALRDSQIDSAVLGYIRAEPLPEELTLCRRRSAPPARRRRGSAAVRPGP